MPTSFPQTRLESTIPPIEGTPDTKLEIRNRKIVAVVSMFLGVGWLAMVVLPPIAKTIEKTPALGDALFLIFLIVMVPLMSIPGILCLWFGYRLFQRRTEDSLRWILGTGVFILTVSIYARVGEIFFGQFFETIWDTPGMLSVALIVAVAYPLLISRLLPAIGGDQKSPRNFVGKGLLTLIAWLVFFALSPAPHSYLRDLKSMEFIGLPILDAILQLLIVLSPFLIPYLGYKLAVRYFVEKET